MEKQMTEVEIKLEKSARRFMMRYRVPILFYGDYHRQLENYLEFNPELKRRWENIKKRITRSN